MGWMLYLLIAVVMLVAATWWIIKQKRETANPFDREIRRLNKRMKGNERDIEQLMERRRRGL